MLQENYKEEHLLGQMKSNILARPSFLLEQMRAKMAIITSPSMRFLIVSTACQQLSKNSTKAPYHGISIL